MTEQCSPVSAKPFRIEIRTSYSFQGGFSFDEIAKKAVGRDPDFSGCGFGQRDLGWVCQSDFEAERIKRALFKLGLRAEIEKRAGEGS